MEKNLFLSQKTLFLGQKVPKNLGKVWKFLKLFFSELSKNYKK